MNRRHLLHMPFAVLLSTASKAQEKPWSARLLKGGFDGKYYWSGLAITLATPWKTYWRVPGDGGIAPQIDMTFENVGDHKILYPLPTRFQDEAGMTIGYKDEVVFPIALEPTDTAQPVKVNFKSFFGVCEVVCIPAQFDGEMKFDPAKADAPDQMLISQWQAKVPMLSLEGPILKATVETTTPKPVLVLDVVEPVDDVFVEGNPLHYFGKPDGTSGLVRLAISGAKSVEELKDNQLRITMNKNGKALEQLMTVR
jgi:DsbC/DsbD-like thiol-disulfide interchange protein